MSNKKRQFTDEGYTLIEMMVSMTIYITLTMLIVGFFIALYRLQMKYQIEAHLQQESRIVSEIFSRKVREANIIEPVIYSWSEQQSGVSVKKNLCLDTDGDDRNNIVISPNIHKLRFTMLDGSTINFDCFKENGVNVLRFGKGSADAFNITTDEVNVNNFMIYRDGDVSYPKTIRYEFEISDRNNEVPPIFLRGYVNIRDER